MITPEYVNHLIDLSRRMMLPVASANLEERKMTVRTIEYKWIIAECLCCGEEHSHFAGYEIDEVHTYLGKHWCPKTSMNYIAMREYDVKRDAGKINPYAGMETTSWNDTTYPIARVRLIKAPKSDGTIDLQWEIIRCPFCNQKHHHPADASLKRVNCTLDRRKSRCVNGGRYYVLQKEKTLRRETR